MTQDQEKRIIRKNIKSDLREKVAQAIITCCVSGMENSQLIKLGMIKKTRSKKFPYITTHYGDLILECTKIGKAFNSIGK